MTKEVLEAPQVFNMLHMVTVKWYQPGTIRFEGITKGKSVKGDADVNKWVSFAAFAVDKTALATESFVVTRKTYDVHGRPSEPSELRRSTEIVSQTLAKEGMLMMGVTGTMGKSIWTYLLGAKGYKEESVHPDCSSTHCARRTFSLIKRCEFIAYVPPKRNTSLASRATL